MTFNILIVLYKHLLFDYVKGTADAAVGAAAGGLQVH